MPPTRAAVVEWMIQFMMNSLELERDAVPLDDRFSAYGLDSLEVIVMVGLMEDEFGFAVQDEIEIQSSIHGMVDALQKVGKVAA